MVKLSARVGSVHYMSCNNHQWDHKIVLHIAGQSFGCMGCARKAYF